MVNKFVQITKTGENFTYQHTAKDEKQHVSMDAIFKTSDRALKGLDRAHAAMTFLRDCFEARAESGESMDEYGQKGAAAVCCAISDMIRAETENTFKETMVIKALVAGEVQ